MRGWGMRLEESPVGRAVLTLAMLLLIGCIALWNLPPGPARQEVRPVVGRVLLPLGLDQDWALFAPDPRRFSVGLHARVTRGDGSVVVWSPPTEGVVLAPYRSYRWQKYVERVRADDYAGLWDRTARWVAAQHGADVTRVVLVRTFREALVPGTAGRRPPRGSFDFYELDLSGAAP